MGFTSSDGRAITDEMLEEMAAEYENGTWSGHGKISAGRPRIFGEEMATISVRIPKSRLAAIERAAQERNESKSEFLREAIDSALLARTI